MKESNTKTLCENMRLTAENVEAIFKDCLSGKVEGDQIIHGVVLKVAFDRSKVVNNRENILSMLSCLPENFFIDKGGGWSFLKLCVDKDGRQWTDFHQTCDKLVCLGLAADAIEFCFKDREMWRVFPGGIPYLAVDLKKGE